MLHFRDSRLDVDLLMKIRDAEEQGIDEPHDEGNRGIADEEDSLIEGIEDQKDVPNGDLPAEIHVSVSSHR